jgi:hypothetical protein
LLPRGESRHPRVEFSLPCLEFSHPRLQFPQPTPEFEQIWAYQTLHGGLRRQQTPQNHAPGRPKTIVWQGVPHPRTHTSQRHQSKPKDSPGLPHARIVSPPDSGHNEQITTNQTTTDRDHPFHDTHRFTTPKRLNEKLAEEEHPWLTKSIDPSAMTGTFKVLSSFHGWFPRESIASKAHYSKAFVWLMLNFFYDCIKSSIIKNTRKI